MKKILIVLISGLFSFQLFGMQCTDKELYGDAEKNKKGMLGLLEDLKVSIKNKIPTPVLYEEQKCEAEAYYSLILEISKLQTRDETSIYFPGATLDTLCSESIMFCMGEKIDAPKILLEYLSLECGFKENLSILHDYCGNYF